jgi:hypothetical protein
MLRDAVLLLAIRSVGRRECILGDDVTQTLDDLLAVNETAHGPAWRKKKIKKNCFGP